MRTVERSRIFYGWWIVGAAFLNLFFSTGVIYYGFPVFYPAFVRSLGFTHAQVTQGFLLGFVAAGLPFGFLTGVLIDRFGARRVILSGIALVGLPLIAMSFMHSFLVYQLLCIVEVIGYVLAGPSRIRCSSPNGFVPVAELRWGLPISGLAWAARWLRPSSTGCCAPSGGDRHS